MAYRLHSSSIVVAANLQICHSLALPQFHTKSQSLSPPISISISNRRSYYLHSKTKTIIAASSMAATTTTDTTTKPSFSVLFVCLGNICRSPAAEGVFTDLVTKRGLLSNFTIDSAGTIGYHEGNEADPRMRASAKRRGIWITSISRPVKPADFRIFDLILVMDHQNRDDVLESLERWRFKETLPADAHNKVKLMCSYCKKHNETQVPDPYYGGAQGFEKVLDILEDACESLLDTILAENKHLLN